VGRLAHRVPLRRIQVEARCPPSVTGRWTTSPGLTCRFRVLYAIEYRRIGFAVPAMTSSFPTRLRGVPRVAVPHNLRCRFILSCASSSLQSFRATTRLSPPGERHLPWGSAPLRDVSRWSPLSPAFAFEPRASHARSVPPSTFLTSSTAFASTDLAGLFHPATASGIHSSGVFPVAQPFGLVTRLCPLVVCGRSLPPVARQRRSRPPVSRALLRASIRRDT
jgi:hypothetical protein